MPTVQATQLTPKGERTREHILDTALSLFIEKGYDATTMRDIAVAAESSLESISHFSRAGRVCAWFRFSESFWNHG